MTALSVYGTNSASSTLSTANTIVTGTGASATTTSTALGKSVTGYGQVVSQGTASAWSAGGSAPAPNGKGWLLDATTLEGQTIASGNWTPTVTLALSSGSATTDIIMRAYKRSSGGTYTNIVTVTKTAQSLTTSATPYSLSATSASAVSFTTGDKLYIDIILNITSGNASAGSIICSMGNSSTQGVANDVQMVAPDYSAPSAPATGGTIGLMGIG